MSSLASLLYSDRYLTAVAKELSVAPFCVTRSNSTHQLTDPTQPSASVGSGAL